MNERSGSRGSAGLVDRLGTAAVFAWWMLTIGALLL